MAAGTKPEGAGSASCGDGTHGVKSGVLTLGTSNGGGRHGGGLPKAEVYTEELAAQGGAGNGEECGRQTVALAAAAVQSAGAVAGSSLAIMHGIAANMLCTMPLVCDMECSLLRRERY